MYKGFTSKEVIIIIIITVVLTISTTSVLMSLFLKQISGISYHRVVLDKPLLEFLNLYSTVVDDYYMEIDSSEMLNEAVIGLNTSITQNKSEVLEGALDNMIDYLGDDFSSYLNGNQTIELEDKLSGTYKGIGIMISGLTIVDVTEDTPAERAGLLPNDIIIGINEIPLSEETSYKIAYYIQYDENEYVDLHINRSGELLDFSIKKEQIDNSVSYTIVKDTNIGYLNLSVFSTNASTQFENALIKLENDNIESLIIDLRNNSGGYLEEAEKIASLFLQKGATIFSLEGQSSTTYYKDETKESRNYEIIILINEETASAAEVLTLALQENGKATTLGTRSYGKGTVQQLVTTSSGTTAKFTTALWYSPNHNSIDKLGINPQIFVIQQQIEDETGKVIEVIDKQYERAVEILKAK